MHVIPSKVLFLWLLAGIHLPSPRSSNCIWVISEGIYFFWIYAKHLYLFSLSSGETDFMIYSTQFSSTCICSCKILRWYNAEYVNLSALGDYMESSCCWNQAVLKMEGRQQPNNHRWSRIVLPRGRDPIPEQVSLVCDPRYKSHRSTQKGSERTSDCSLLVCYCSVSKQS